MIILRNALRALHLHEWKETHSRTAELLSITLRIAVALRRKNIFFYFSFSVKKKRIVSIIVILVAFISRDRRFYEL